MSSPRYKAGQTAWMKVKIIKLSYEEDEDFDDMYVVRAPHGPTLIASVGDLRKDLK